jgi:NADPH-dependent glutamate synthase beta subunit-like oxidoreductase
MTITLEESVLKLGKDFVDCVAGRFCSHGYVTIGKKTYLWESTVGITESERAIRASATREGKTVSLFVSQSG